MAAQDRLDPQPELPTTPPAAPAARTWWDRIIRYGWVPFWISLGIAWFALLYMPPLSHLATLVLGSAWLVLLVATMAPGFASTILSARRKPVATIARWMVIAGIAGYVGYFFYTAQFAWSREQQGRAQWQLRQIHRAEQAYFEKHKRYGTFEEIGKEIGFNLVVVETPSYTFRIGNGQGGAIGLRKDPTPDNTIVSAALSPDGQHFTATATGNLDDDATLDQWHVTDAAEWPVHDVDDLENWPLKPR